MNGGDFELTLGDVSDMEATVYARYLPAADAAMEVSGTLRGPYCEGVRTLSAEFAFRPLGPERPGVAAAVVTDPCMWSPELPHLYHVEVEARRGGEVVAGYRGTMGLRKSQIDD